jgi:hypothetical protein
MWQQPKVAIVMFGLTRSLPNTIQSLQQHLFDIFSENNIEYDIYQHTYIFRNKYLNKWSKEEIDTYPNNDFTIIPALKRNIEYQEDVIETIDFDEYYTQPTTWTGEWDPNFGKYVIRNMILGYRSRKHAFQLVEPNLTQYSHVLFIRPDLELLEPFDLSIFSLLKGKNNMVCIPEQDSFSGVNDKVLVCNSEAARSIGYLFDELLPYSKENQIVAENFLFRKLEEYNLKITLIDWPHRVLRMSCPTS